MCHLVGTGCYQSWFCPMYQIIHLKQIGENIFHSVHKLWNSLLKDVLNLVSIAVFKTCPGAVVLNPSSIVTQLTDHVHVCDALNTTI